MITTNPAKVKRVQTKLLRWYRTNGRDFLWRKTYNPYVVLVSEVMLQQTQSSRVAEKLPPFLERFPSLSSVAKANKSDVVRAWRGMGYNNRAARLWELAKVVVNERRAQLPKNAEELQQLPGIGPYTAHAIACFAFRARVPVVDVNVRRVFSRLFWKMKTHSAVRDAREIWKLATDILPRNAYSWNQALMELGSTICLARKPICPRCPVSAVCLSQHLENARHSNLNPQTPNPEPSYLGLPRRIWRGKIVEALRHVNGKGSPKLLALGKLVRKDFGKKDMLWLLNVVENLEKDRVVRVIRDGKNTKVSLAHT